MRVRLRQVLIGLISMLVLMTAGLAVVLIPPATPPIQFPNGHSFAFTIIDDTDRATLDNIRPIYDFLREIGLRTTKTVWMLATNDSLNWANIGHTMADSAYREFVLELQRDGFEIASHGARGGSSSRDEIIAAMEQFRELFGDYPSIHINHSSNLDNIYWGGDKLTIGPFRWFYDMAIDGSRYYGHDSTSEYFWGDFARGHIAYVVNFSFHNIDIRSVNPSMPYHSEEQEFVNYWFHTSDGGVVSSFNDLLREENLDALEDHRGVCIVYTHFGKQFYRDGEIDSTTIERLNDLAGRNGWFVPASELLAYLQQQPGNSATLSFREQVRLELLWFWDKMVYGST